MVRMKCLSVVFVSGEIGLLSIVRKSEREEKFLKE